jgi:hypothetical protein
LRYAHLIVKPFLGVGKLANDYLATCLGELGLNVTPVVEVPSEQGALSCFGGTLECLEVLAFFFLFEVLGTLVRREGCEVLLSP